MPEINPHMLARGRELAAEARSVRIFAPWSATSIAGHWAAPATQSWPISHIMWWSSNVCLMPWQERWCPTEICHLDTIGRNGHQRWFEALALVQTFWREPGVLSTQSG